jgi:hypothetical protein
LILVLAAFFTAVFFTRGATFGLGGFLFINFARSMASTGSFGLGPKLDTKKHQIAIHQVAVGAKK